MKCAISSKDDAVSIIGGYALCYKHAKEMGILILEGLAPTEAFRSFVTLEKK